MLFGNRFSMAVHIVIGAQKFMRKSRGHFVCWQSARGLAHSKTLRVFQESSCRAQRFGLRRPSAALPRGISNCAHVNWNCHSQAAQKPLVQRLVFLETNLQTKKPPDSSSSGFMINLIKSALPPADEVERNCQS